MVLLTIVGINFLFQIYQKPLEVLSLFSLTKPKTVMETWSSYGTDFQKYSTHQVPPELLAAIAQSESSGNPLASPGWTWKLSSLWSKIYSPASSSFGLFQSTKGTFAEGTDLCMIDREVIPRSPWYNFDSCWLHGIYSRAWPSHAIKAAALKLHFDLTSITRNHRIKNVSSTDRAKLAAVIHLCGRQRAEKFVRDRFQFRGNAHCGTHHAPSYVNRILKLTRNFKSFI